MELGTNIGTYKGREILGFEQDYTYMLELSHNGRLYTVHALSDLTNPEDIKEVNLWIHYASPISIGYNWIAEEKETTEGGE